MSNMIPVKALRILFRCSYNASAINRLVYQPGTVYGPSNYAILRESNTEPVEAFVENRPTEQNETKGEGEFFGAQAYSSIDRQEIEWQYDAPDGLERVKEWLGGCVPEGFTVVGGYSKDLTDTYYDTENWRLYRAGYALRIRREVRGEKSEATMKSLTSGNVGNLRRWREISEPLKSEEELLRAPGPVGECLRTLVSPCELRPLFEIRTHRRTFDLVLGTVRVGEVVLDRSEIPLRDSDEPACLARVEVEVDASATTIAPELKSFVEAMEETLGLRPATTSKYEVGLLASGRSPNGGKPG